MKKIIMVAAAAAALFSAPAIAADMPVKADPLFNWTGWYLGGNGGYSWGKSRVTATQTAPAATVTTSVRHEGGEGSGEGGYCWQQNSTDGTRVICIEARYDFPREQGHGTIGLPSGTVTPTTQIDPLLIGPHIGFATDLNRTLWYLAGGLATGPVGGNASTVDIGGTAGNANPGTKWKAGWFLGAGVERMVDNHWSVKLEYDYVRIGGDGSGPSALITPAGRFGAGSTVAIGGRAYDNVISAGINYHFGTH